MGVALAAVAQDGDRLALEATEVGVLVTISTAADLVLFPAASYVMDRFGRRYAMVPSFGLIVVGLLLLAGADTAAGVTVAAAVMGIGNGLGAGTMLTLGSDLAPPEAPGPFLAAMAVVGDSGRVIGPLLVGIVGAAMGLGAAAIALAIGCVLLLVWTVAALGETSTIDHENPTP